MITRRLNYDDFANIVNVINLRWAQVKKRRQSDHNKILIDRIKNYIDLSILINDVDDVSGLGQVFGSFDNQGELISFCTQKFFKSMPYFYLGNMTVKPNVSNLYNIKSTGLGKCWDDAVEFAESKNYFTWYWVTELRGWNHREQQWYDNCSAFRRYHTYIDSIYEKGENGKYKYQRDMIGEYGANTNIAIKYATLKPELKHLHFQNKLKEKFIPLQYNTLSEKDRYVSEKVTFEERNREEINTLIKDENNMITGDSYYQKNFPDIAKGEHKHFVAIVNNKIVGTSSMTRFYHNETKKYRVYHRSSWTHPNYRHKKIWFKLMKYKAKYIKDNNWCDDNTLNFVAVSINDKRYKNIGWKFHKQYKKDLYLKDIWYTYWKDYKNV